MPPLASIPIDTSKLPSVTLHSATTDRPPNPPTIRPPRARILIDESWRIKQIFPRPQNSNLKPKPEEKTFPPIGDNTCYATGFEDLN